MVKFDLQNFDRLKARAQYKKTIVKLISLKPQCTTIYTFNTTKSNSVSMCNSQTRSYNHKPENKTYNSVVCICFFLTFKLQLVLFVCAHFPNWFGRPFCFRGLMPLFPSQHLFFKCRAPPVKRSLPKLNCMHCDGTNTSFC